MGTRPSIPAIRSLRLSMPSSTWPPDVGPVQGRNPQPFGFFEGFDVRELLRPTASQAMSSEFNFASIDLSVAPKYQ